MVVPPQAAARFGIIHLDDIKGGRLEENVVVFCYCLGEDRWMNWL